MIKTTDDRRLHYYLDKLENKIKMNPDNFNDHFKDFNMIYRDYKYDFDIMNDGSTICYEFYLYDDSDELVKMIELELDPY